MEIKYTLYVFKDKQIDRFMAPACSNLHDPEELKEDVRVQIIKTDNRRVFKGKDLYILGEYNATKGHIVSKKEPYFLMNCDEVLSEVESYEQAKNRGSENN